MNETAKFNRELTADVIEGLRIDFKETPSDEDALDVVQTFYGTAYECEEMLDLFPKLQRHQCGPATSELNKLIQKLAVTADYMRAAADRAESDIVNATRHSEECVKICNEILRSWRKENE
jgi:hypothetical protein